VVCLAAPAQGRETGGKSSKSRTDKQTRGAETPIDEFMGMSQEEQTEALNRLPRAERMRLQQRLQRFNQLPPQQQQALRKLYDRLHQLPADRQKAVRKSLNQFSQQPTARRQAMRQELRSIAPLEAEDRKTRMATPEFREKFSEKEQGIIRDMSDLFPPR
jgi:gas vesicle protein